LHPHRPTSLITTPIYYVNSQPHLGHAYTTILADIIKRYQEQRGVDTMLLTGTDEHGEKIEQKAKAEGLDVRDFVDKISSQFRHEWEQLGISFDVFYRTTEKGHIAVVQQVLQMLKDRGEIVFREYEGNYCVGCERFLTDTELTKEGLCPDHLRKPEPRKEANYFFLMSRYHEKLIHHFEQNSSSIRPDHYRQEMLSFLRQPLGDLCISRPKERLAWGIELPFDSNFVTYVWFDALLNYLIATGWPGADWDQPLWSSATHLIAKDILKAHAIYWGAMLMALGVTPPREIHVSGYWLVDGTKMSKSLGNVVRPLELEQRFGRDTLRFYLLREMSYGLDSTFTLENYLTCINAHLANGFGNFVARVYTIGKKNLGTVEFSDSDLLDRDKELLQQRYRTREAWDKGFSDLKYQNSLKAWCEMVTACDLYINEMKPWVLAKNPDLISRLHTVIGVSMRMVQAMGALIAPVLPHAAREIEKALSLGEGHFRTVDGGFEDRCRFELSAEVPKLFLRVSMPEEYKSEVTNG
jgi:methionyl-tRNA synthetase